MGNFAEPMAGVDGVKDYRFLLRFSGTGIDGDVHAASVDIPSITINENRYQEGNNSYPAKIPGSVDYGDVSITKALFKNDTKMTQRFCQQVQALQGIPQSNWGKFLTFDVTIFVIDDYTGNADLSSFHTKLEKCWFKSLGYGGLNATSSGQLIMKSFTLSVQHVEIGGSTEAIARAQGTA
jgi:hypothetical protein